MDMFDMEKHPHCSIINMLEVLKS